MFTMRFSAMLLAAVVPVVAVVAAAGAGDCTRTVAAARLVTMTDNELMNPELKRKASEGLEVKLGRLQKELDDLRRQIKTK